MPFPQIPNLSRAFSSTEKFPSTPTRDIFRFMRASIHEMETGDQKDLWLIVREGSLADVEVALAQAKKNGANVNSKNTFGLTPLHIATWRNHIPIVKRLLAAGADPDVRFQSGIFSSSILRTTNHAHKHRNKREIPTLEGLDSLNVHYGAIAEFGSAIYG
ncbi:hypothetical protein AKJ16_DCAP16860 [Drosera capensis]